MGVFIAAEACASMPQALRTCFYQALTDRGDERTGDILVLQLLSELPVDTSLEGVCLRPQLAGGM